MFRFLHKFQYITVLLIYLYNFSDAFDEVWKDHGLHELEFTRQSLLPLRENPLVRLED